jgi:cellulose biosynthesis protein BcsQ
LTRKPKAFEFLSSDIGALGFEYVIFDCSPSFSQLERAIIGDVDEVVNPLSPEFFSVDGIEIFRHELKSIEEANRRHIQNDKIIVNLVNRSFARHKEFLGALMKLDYSVYIVPQDSKIAESQVMHQSVYEYAPTTKSVALIEDIATALMAE